MKFKQFLLEADISDTNLKKIIQYVESTYLNVFLKAPNILDDLDVNLIFRGSGNEHKDIEIRNYPKKRMSANTSNEFTFLVDNFIPSWKNFPKRSESFICSTSPFIAEGFGEVFYVLPFGNPDIGVCSDNDIWVSMSKLNEIDTSDEPVPNFNNSIQEIFKFIFPKTNVGKDMYMYQEGIETLEQMKKFVEEAEVLIKDEKRMSLIISKLNSSKKDSASKAAIKILQLAKANGGFIKGLNVLLNPKANGMQLMKAQEILNNKRKFYDKEVWFSAQSAFIRDDYDLLVTIKERIKKLKGK